MESELTSEQRLERAVPHIAASLERSNPDGNTIEEVLGAIRTGEAHLWENEEAAAVTVFVQTARISLDELVWAAGGKMGPLMEILTKGSDWLAENGFDRLMIEDTRKGWAKALKPHGFRLATVLIKDL